MTLLAGCYILLGILGDMRPVYETAQVVVGLLKAKVSSSDRVMSVVQESEADWGSSRDGQGGCSTSGKVKEVVLE